MKKTFQYTFLIFINYLLVSMLVFIFSYISLINKNIYDYFWIKSVQKSLYYDGLRNVWQLNQECSEFDNQLLYKPKIGECLFSNPEFETKINFDQHRRLNNENDKINNKDDLIAVLGDSLAMGWGVNGNKTLSFHLQTLLKKKVLNLGVSSYGSIREIKNFKSNKFYDQVNTVIIQYHINDILENLDLDPDKNYTKEDYTDFFLTNKSKVNKFYFLFTQYLKTTKIFFKDIINFLTIDSNLQKHNLFQHMEILDKIVEDNFKNENLEIIVLFIKEPHVKIIGNKNYNFKNFKLLVVNADKSNFFLMDDHLNEKGHYYIGKKLYEYLK